MSTIQDYFPPPQGDGGTKYQWSNKALNYSPWVCRLWDHWPASIICRVHALEDGIFSYSVEVRGFYHDHHILGGETRSALEACLSAERLGEAQKALIWQPWMDSAIAAGWRPPA